MAASIVHFGLNSLGYLTLLTKAGYSVEKCGRSLPQFQAVIERQAFDAVAVSDDGHPFHELPATVRSVASVPLILFRDVSSSYNIADFDVVVTDLVPAEAWMRRLDRLIQQSRTARAAAQATRQSAESLREAAQSARGEAVALRRAGQAQQDRFLARFRETTAPQSAQPLAGIPGELKQLYRDRENLEFALGLKLAEDVRVLFSRRLADIEQQIAELEAKLAN